MDNGASSYRRFLNGDDSGMVELVHDYKNGLLLYLNGYVNNLNIAENCVQETFIKLAIKRPKFRGDSSFKTWLYAIGRNTVLSYLRKSARHSDILIDECEDLASETDLECEYLREEQRITLHRTLCKLKTEYRLVLYLTYFEDFSNEETAAIMKKTKKQVENLLYNARKSLKFELEKEDFQYEEL